MGKLLWDFFLNGENIRYNRLFFPNYFREFNFGYSFGYFWLFLGIGITN